MIAIFKDNLVPTKLNNATTDDEFKKNVAAKKYVGNNRYSTVKEELHEIYHNKCAFCESDITAGSYNHIEHYRPKAIYYWLAYSWDNLLLSCPKCNTKKSDLFEIENENRAEYDNESLNELHNKISEYDNIEQPKLLNPEQTTEEELKSHFSFTPKGKLLPISERMKYTEKLCDLNRTELVKKRFALLNDFLKMYDLINDKSEAKNAIINILERSIENNEEYIAWKKFLLVIMKRLKDKVQP